MIALSRVSRTIPEIREEERKVFSSIYDTSGI